MHLKFYTQQNTDISAAVWTDTQWLFSTNQEQLYSGQVHSESLVNTRREVGIHRGWDQSMFGRCKETRETRRKAMKQHTELHTFNNIQ